MKAMSLSQFLHQGEHIDIVTEMNKDLSQFHIHMDEANKIMEGIRLQNEHNAAVVKKMTEILNDPQGTAKMEEVLRNSSTPLPPIENLSVPTPVPTQPSTSWFDKFIERGKVGNEGVTGGTNGLEEKIESLSSSLDSISKFCDGVTWIVGHPREVAKMILSGLSGALYMIALVVCAGAILMRIFGHKEGLKYCPMAMVIYFLIKVVAVVI